MQRPVCPTDRADNRFGAARDFLSRAEGASVDAVQQLCARVTGNYKRGNESTAAKTRKLKGRDV